MVAITRQISFELVSIRALASEFIGTFIIVYFGCGSIVNQFSHDALGHNGVSLAFGLAVFAGIYIGAPVSGAHLNPAVTLGFFVLGKCSSSKLSAYVATQVTGAIFAAALLSLTPQPVLRLQ